MHYAAPVSGYADSFNTDRTQVISVQLYVREGCVFRRYDVKVCWVYLLSVSVSVTSFPLLIDLFTSISNNTALMLLCEVAARPFHELKNADYYADKTCATNKKL